MPDCLDISPHKQHTLPGVAPQRELQAYISQVLTREFDPSRPMWEVIIVRYEADGGANAGQRCDLVWRLAHSIGDGITLATLD